MAKQKSSKNSRNNTTGGLDELSAHFSGLYAERWPQLLAALQAPELQVARLNSYSEPPASLPQVYPHLSGCYEWNGGTLERDSNGLLHFYVMDPASIICARALEVQDDDQVLDMCAAPGGKTLILAEALKTGGEILANELSAGRRERLKKVIQQYVSREARDRVWVTGKDGGLFAKSHAEKFDRVLVDAPCSGERHLLQSAKDLAEWSIGRSQKLAQRQYALLTAALLVAKPGARIVYSTCSISPIENDEVIAKLLHKKGDSFTVVSYSSDSKAVVSEKTQYGQQYFPDRVGFGPIYFSVLQKN